MAEALLALEGLRAGYGDAVVLDGITFEVRDGGSLALLGRNGVGKTTLLLTIMGFTRVSRGTIAWRGRDITRLAPHGRARDGIGWVAQEREIFPSLNVEENLTVTRGGTVVAGAGLSSVPAAQGRRASAAMPLGRRAAGAGDRALMTNPAAPARRPLRAWRRSSSRN
jgi:branched-chain amino acid transport system ATP-binding protein